MASRAEELFDRIIRHPRGPQAGVQELIDSKFHEREYLDYKIADRRINDAKIKEHWSKSLSAYANTGGGVVIWGVNCKNVAHPELPKDSKGKVVELDEPDELAPHPVARDLAQSLADWKRDATDDVVENVRVETVTFGGTTEGCVVCLIPEGRNKPYRAMYADEKYWMRDIDRMTVIPHSLLRSLFHPRVEPKVEVEVLGRFNPGNVNAVEFRVEIVN